MLHILYTQEEGGDFFQIAKNSDEETKQLFDETVLTGNMIFQIGDRITKIRPAYIALVETKEDYDFVQKDSRLNPKKLLEEPQLLVEGAPPPDETVTIEEVKLEESVINSTGTPNDTPKS